MAEEWPDAALEALDSMWAIDTHMGVMRRRLTALLGFMPEPGDVRTMAGRPKAPVKALAVIAPFVALTDQENSVFFAPRPRPDNVLRRVPRGTYPVPVGGFRLGQGRVP